MTSSFFLSDSFHTNKESAERIDSLWKRDGIIQDKSLSLDDK